MSYRTPAEGAEYAPTPNGDPLTARQSLLRRATLWLTLGVLVAAAVLGGVFIIIGDQSGVAGRAWLTLLLVTGFAGMVLLDGAVGDGPNKWYLAASTITNVVLLVIGLLKVWNGPLQPGDTIDAGVWSEQIARWIGLVLLARLVLLITQVYVHRFIANGRSAVTRASAWVTLAFLWLTALVWAIPLSFPNLAPIGIPQGYGDVWWRIAGATLLVAAVSAVVPVVVYAFGPKPAKPQPAAAPYGPVGQVPQAPGWPAQYAPQQGQPQAPGWPPQPQGSPAQPGFGQQPPHPGYPPQPPHPGFPPQPQHPSYGQPAYPAQPPVSPPQRPATPTQPPVPSQAPAAPASQPPASPAPPVPPVPPLPDQRPPVPPQ